MTSTTAMPGSVAAYNVNPWNNTQASGLRKDDKNSLADGASCPTSNATFTPKQHNRGKHDPTTSNTNNENPSVHQRQKKPRRGVKVDTAAKEKKDLGMCYLRNPSINPADIFPKDMPKSVALISLVRERSVPTLIATSLTLGKLWSSNMRQSS
jgi:hypothetical protein